MKGGRRLYTDKDIVKLHQILSLKHLGFSLDDIKNRLIPLDTPDEIADVLMEQAAAVKRKIESLSESLRDRYAYSVNDCIWRDNGSVNWPAPFSC